MSTYTYKTKTLPKSAVELELSVPWEQVSKKNDIVVTRAIATITVPGFRKGKAPRALAEARLNRDVVYEEIVRELIGEIYGEIVEKEKYHPIGTPSVDLKEAKQGESWLMHVTVPLMPVVKLKKYKEKIKDAHAKAAKEAAEKSSKEEKVKKEESTVDADGKDGLIETDKKDAPVTAPLTEVFDILLAESELEVPELLTNEDVNRRLSQLVTDIQKVGLTPAQYLTSKKITEEELRKQYFKDSEDMYKIEFVIAKIADEEGLKVTEDELKKIYDTAQTEEERMIAARNMTWYETMLRKQKVIDFLNTL
jgi:FKBP-type peptidyl-prolyl cis-trans isomerase (trigger factor)